MIRLVHLLKRRPGVSQEEFSVRWRDRHGPLVAASQTKLALLRYVQIHRDPAGKDLDIKASDARGGTEPPVDGIAEYWWQSEDALKEALATTAGSDAHAGLIEDEAGFVDQAASPLWIAHEYPQVGTTLHRPVAHWKTGVMRLTFAFHQLSHLAADEARRYWLTMHGPLVRSHSGARGLIGYNQVHRHDCELAREIRTGRRSTIEPYLGHAESWFDRIALKDGPEMRNATAAAIADERNFIDWTRSMIFVGKELVFVDRDWT